MATLTFNGAAQEVTGSCYLLETVGVASIDAPRGNLTGDPYFTDGRRISMWISNQPVSVSEIEIQPM